jgi:hypothetical protein
MTLSTYLIMVVRVVPVVPGSEVVVRRKGERMVRAEDWTARSTSSLAHQLIN